MPGRVKGPNESSTPERYGNSTPPPMPSGDYSYTVEIVMAMQNSLGKLTEAVETLKTVQSKQGDKLDSLDKKVYAGIVLITVFGALLTLFAKSINDAVTNRLLAPTPIIQQQQAPPTSSNPTR